MVVSRGLDDSLELAKTGRHQVSTRFPARVFQKLHGPTIFTYLCTRSGDSEIGPLMIHCPFAAYLLACLFWTARMKILLGIIFSVCSAFAAIADSAPVRVGALVSLSGNWAAIGENIQRGITLALEEVNERGGVLGRPLTVLYQDTDEEKNGTKVVSAYRFMRAQGVRFFIGPIGVPGIMALTPIAAKESVLLIGPTATNSFYKMSKRFFNSSGDNYVTTKATAERAYARGFRRVAIFGNMQPWEHQQAETFREEFLRLGGTIVAEVYPAPDQIDLELEALRIVKSKPDAVFFAIFNQIAHAAKALHTLNYSGGKFMSHSDDAHLVGSGGGLEGCEFYLFKFAGAAFTEKFQRRFKSPPGLFADSAYDALLSLAQAINAAGGSRPDEVAAALHQLRFTGSAGVPTGYSADGLIVRDISLYFVRGGKILPAAAPY